MKRILSILALLTVALSSQAADIITKRLTVTNAANINSTNAYKVTVNADERTWTNNVVTPSTQILSTTNNATAVIRLLTHFATYPIADTELLTDGSTYVAWRGEAGDALDLTLSTNTWGAVTATTNTVGTAGVVVSVPYSFFSAANQTNIANGLSDWLNLAANTTGINAAKLLAGTVPLARLSGITTNEIDAVFHGLLMTGDTDDQTAAEVPFTPAGAIAATDVQAALAEVDTEKQPADADLTDLADGSLTGSKVGTGIDAGNITAGTLAEARIHADIARDSEIAAAIDDSVYGVGWAADTTHAPSRKAVYDKIEAMLLGGGLGTGDIDTSAELRGIVTDESGTGALIFAGGDIGAATATSPSANDDDTSVATTEFVQDELTAYASDAVTFTAKKISYSAALGSDDTYQGTQISGLNNSGGVTQWDAVYLNSSSEWVIADANGSGTYPARGIAASTETTGNPVLVITSGTIRNDAWAWTIGGTIYLSATPGGLTQTAPSTTGDRVQIIGYALTADIVAVHISPDYGTAP